MLNFSKRNPKIKYKRRQFLTFCCLEEIILSEIIIKAIINKNQKLKIVFIHFLISLKVMVAKNDRFLSINNFLYLINLLLII